MAITFDVDHNRQLTKFNVQGILNYNQVMEAAETFYSGDPTRYVLWNLNDVTDIDISNEEINKIAGFKPRFESSRPAGGKTAIVASKSLHFGLSRMFEIYSDLKEVPFQVSIFRTMEEADAWFEE